MAQSPQKTEKTKIDSEAKLPIDLGEVVEKIMKLQYFIIRLFREADRVHFIRSYGGNRVEKANWDDIWKRLDKRKFCRADPFTICNIKEVSYCYPYMEGLHAVMSDGIIIKVSKSNKKRFKKKAWDCPTVTWGPPPKKAGS